MKNFLLIGLTLLLFSCSEQIENEKTLVVEKLGESYGPNIEDLNVSNAISVEVMLNDYKEQSVEKEYTFVGELTEVCSNAGCWVNIDKGNGETFMVMFKDHFTIPMDTKVNEEAYFHGVLYRDTISVEYLKHFAEDAGKSQEEIDLITEPEYELSFTADAITLKK